MYQLLLVGVGGFAGSVMRYLVYISLQFYNKDAAIYATLFVNISGSFLIGVLAALFYKEALISNELKLFLIAGMLGGFTTFSAFSLENLSLLQKGEIFSVIFYSALSCAAGLAAAWLGWRIVIS